MYQFDSNNLYYGYVPVVPSSSSFVGPGPETVGPFVGQNDQNVIAQVECTSNQKISEWKDTSLISFHHMLEGFIKSSEDRFYLPSNLTTQQKNYLLTLVQCLNLKLKHGRREAAYVLKAPKTVPLVRMLVLGYESKLKIENFFKAVDSKGKERSDGLKPFTFRPGVAVLTGGTPRIPRKARTNEFQSHRELLPIFRYRQQILDLIKNNTYCLIKGDAGVGKSTQIPQYILEEAQETSKPVRILVCLPRRAGVIAICDRVASERGEPVGHTVGYQVHLESCSSPVETLLNFVTGPVLLRALAIPGCHLLENTTHLILDGIHCRNRYQDFLMNCLRDLVANKSHLKLIFVGQDINLGFVSEYFGGSAMCPELNIPGNGYQVATYYMDDILRFSWSTNNGRNTHYMYSVASPKSEEVKAANAKIVYNVDSLIEGVWKRKDSENSCFYDFVQLVRDDEISVDYAHSVTLITMLMAASCAGLTEFVRELLDLDADVSLRSSNGYAAMDWASYFNHFDIVHMLSQKSQEGSADEFAHNNADPRECLLRDYYRRTDSKGVDLVLIVRLIHMIHAAELSNGTILIFLPTYEDMTMLKDCLFESCRKDPGWNAGENPFVIHFLHAHTQTANQRAAFEPLKPNYRKIILAANVGEDCITFQDIVSVVDTGKYKTPEGYCWVSKVEANQRKSRAGRCGPGSCFRLYSSTCYENEMADFVVPEILRCSLHTLCLQCRSLLKNDVLIEEFFELLPTPPETRVTREAVYTLKLIGALEEDEQLSDLGVHLLEYDIEPQWAKALLYSVVFKCMDPILTIAAYLSYGDAFIPQSHPQHRMLANQRKLDLAGGTFSDHNAILKAFQNWETFKAAGNGNIDQFCSTSYLSAPTFEIVYGIRSRLLGQIRASGFIRAKGPNDIRDLNSNSDNWTVVKAVLTTALYPNIGVVNRITREIANRNSGDIKLHSSSVLRIQDFNWIQELPSDWLIYNDLEWANGKSWIRGCTVVNAVTVALFAGDLSARPEIIDLPASPFVQGTGLNFTVEDRAMCGPQVNKVCLAIDHWARMFSFDSTITQLVPLREKLRMLVLNRMRKPEAFPTKAEATLLQAIMNILTVEDARVGLKHSSVGQWPKLVSGNLLSTPRTGFEVNH